MTSRDQGKWPKPMEAPQSAAPPSLSAPEREGLSQPDSRVRREGEKNQDTLSLKAVERVSRHCRLRCLFRRSAAATQPPTIRRLSWLNAPTHTLSDARPFRVARDKTATSSRARRPGPESTV